MMMNSIIICESFDFYEYVFILIFLMCFVLAPFLRSCSVC
jgi:hypothetical protein